MKCLYCHNREIAKSGRGYKLLLCRDCNLALDIAGSEEGRTLQLNRAMMVAMEHFERWLAHPDQYEEPPWAREFLRLRNGACVTDEVACELSAQGAKKTKAEMDRERRRRFYRAHKDSELKRVKTWRKENREKYNAMQRAWRERCWNDERRERKNAWQREWWERKGKENHEARRAEWDTPEHRKKNLERVLAWKKAHPEKVREQQRRRLARKRAEAKGESAK